MKRDKRAKAIERAVRLAWSSLESHLMYTHKKSWEKQAFHKRCVAEYAEVIQLLSKLY